MKVACSLPNLHGKSCSPWLSEQQVFSARRNRYEQPAALVASQGSAIATPRRYSPCNQPNVNSELLSRTQLGPWQEAARNFVLNSDFDISAELDEEVIGLTELMAIMKEQSLGKRTIQAIADKILLHQLLDNLGVKQMPILYSSHGSIDAGKVEQLVNELQQSGESDRFDIVVKPTHLSNCSGSLILSTKVWETDEYNAEELVEHMETYMAEKAHETESAALQSLIPGFIVQPKYKSCLDWGCPIEIRIVTLWGKTRLGVWWWGARDPNNDSIRWERNAWIAQADGQATKQWQVVHENHNKTHAYDQGLQLILQSMPRMAKIAETIAIAIGTPFLRSDFFIGSPKWGIRLNEVAYGSNIEMRRVAKGPLGYADDSAAIAQILQEGFKYCTSQPPEYFLGRLGAEGDSYDPAWWKFWSRTPAMQISQLAEEVGEEPTRAVKSPPQSSPAPLTHKKTGSGSHPTNTTNRPKNIVRI